MKKLITYLFLSLFFYNVMSAQEWRRHLPQDKVENNTVNFKDIQEAFYKEYPADEIKDGKRVVNGNTEKIPGWKQFKRWEWYWEQRVDVETGEFPGKKAIDELLENNKNRTAVNGGGDWTNLGPVSSSGGYAGIGRINCIGFHPSNTNTFWAGAAGGGLWKTTNGGSTWTVQTDDEDVLGISDIAVSPDFSSSNTIYIGTGDKNGTNNNSVGVLKSTDGGDSWFTTGLTFQVSAYEQVHRILINPSNTQVLLAATTDGIYKSTNGGDSWQRKTEIGTFCAMEYKPGDPNTVYAASLSSFYKSTNGGDNWSFVQSVSGSGIEMCVSPNASSLVYALATNSSGGLLGIYKSTNSGSSYSTVYTGGNNYALFGYSCDGSGANTGQGWYDRCIAVDPNNANILYIGGINTWKSTDGGYSWSIKNHWSSTCNGYAQCIHADKHCLSFQNNSSILFEGNDGGLYKSTNGGSTWSDLSNGMAISQLYKIGVSQTNYDVVIAGLQDNGTKVSSGNNWYDILGGDGMECLIDYTNVDVQYGTLYYGQLYKTNNFWNSSYEISANIPIGASGSWVTPFIIDPSYNQTIYIGYSDVWKTNDGGNSWSKISNINTGNKIRSMAICSSNNQVLYVADQNNIWKTSNGGYSWVNITGALPTNYAYITSIEIKNDNPNTAWVSFGSYNSHCIYQTTNGGSSWTNISTGLPNIPVSSVIQNKQNQDEIELYAGTDVGVYKKLGNTNWTPFSNSLPNAEITELEIYYSSNPANSKLRAATYGRGLWETSFIDNGTGSVGNPISLTATPVSNSQIDLNWTKNSNNAPVLLAFSLNPTFGVPANGNTYSQGDAIPGGGTVLYYGSLTEYNHTSLSVNTNYYYKAWSYETPEYSSGVTAEASTPTYCSSTYTKTGSEYIVNVEFNTINNHSGDDPDDGYSDFTSLSTEVNKGSNYNILVTINTVGNYIDHCQVYFDWNQDLDFTDPGEEYDLGEIQNVTAGMLSSEINIPLNALLGETRMRVNIEYNYNPGPCDSDHTSEWGETEDYSITIASELLIPIAEFNANQQSICSGESVSFTDLSSNSPYSWSWDFGDGTPVVYSQNPSHTYYDAGTYTVELTVGNSNGSDTEIKSNFITVSELPTSGFTVNTDNEPLIYFQNTSIGADSYSWDLGDNTIATTTNVSHQYASNGTYIVVLSAINNCGTSTDQQEVNIVGNDLTEVNNNKVLVYPNPTNKSITIYLTSDNSRIQLFSSNNEFIKELYSKNSKKVEIDMSSYSNGLYNLVITTENNEVVTVKVMKN